MKNDDLEQWLKAANENKITTKNTWKSSLIDHFTDLSTFQEKEGINFQKASCTLDGCIKVYSTRVDDVSNNTMKLMEIFTKEESSTLKQKNKKKSNFLESNFQNINIKMKESEDYYDSIFQSIFSRTDDAPLLNVLEQRSSGMLLYHQDDEREILLKPFPVELECKNLLICGGLKDFKDFEHMILNESFDNQMDIVGSEEYGELIEDMLGDEANEETILDTAAIPVASPFEYFNGWAGPAHWKTEIKKAKSKPDRIKVPKEVFKLDFTEEINKQLLYEKVDPTMTKQAIKDRRYNKNMQPEDFSCDIADLYRFLVRDGSFAKINCENFSVDDNASNLDQSACNLSVVDSKILEEFGNEIVCDLEDLNNNTEPIDDEIEQPMSERYSVEKQQTVVETIKFTKVAKKVDIKKLQENIYKSITKNKTNLSTIYNKIPRIYDIKEAKDISIHFCLISLLHLANEKGLELKNTAGDVEICKTTNYAQNEQ